MMMMMLIINIMIMAMEIKSHHDEMNGLKCDLSPSRGARGRARSVQIVDCCVHTSTAGLGVTSPFDADAAV